MFAAVGAALARATGMTPTQARGTLRLLLKERGLDPRIARKDDIRPLIGAPLEQALAKRHVTVKESGLADVRRALEAADELDDAYDLFSDMD
jgi:hypothetical protein